MGAQYREIKEDLTKQSRAIERQRNRALTRRKELAESLDSLTSRLRQGEFQAVIRDGLETLANDLKGVENLLDPDLRVRTILDAETSARRRLADLRQEFQVGVPRGVGLPQTLRRDINIYRSELSLAEEKEFQPAFARIEEIVATAIKRSGEDVDRRRRFDIRAQTAQENARSYLTIRRREAVDVLDQTEHTVRATIRDVFAEFDASLRGITQKVQSTEIAQMKDAELVQLSLELDAEVETVAHRKQELLDSISEQLKSITVARDESGEIVSHLDLIQANEEELLALRERADADLELTHLGMAIEIIDHEFQATIQAIRDSLRRLGAWANVNVELQDVYEGIRTNFDHLDGYLTLFTPLHRRLYRSEVEIKGSEISKFVRDLFRERLRRHKIEIKPTRRFLNYRFSGYPSTFYPVFVNIVDNAQFWLKDRPEPRVIRLDFDGTAMIIADTGPGVLDADREAIFELGFTRKPGGRGMGLHISKDVLAKIGYDLTVDETSSNRGATFKIQPKAGDHA